MVFSPLDSDGLILVIWPCSEAPSAILDTPDSQAHKALAKPAPQYDELRGAPGMPEAGYIPIPKKLARGGLRDMVRISDARMSGTAFGTIVLHICPEAALGGPLSKVRNGDRIRLDVPARRLELLVEDAELVRRAAVLPAEAPAARCYKHLHVEHVLQADEGCDLDFLTQRPYTAKAPV